MLNKDTTSYLLAFAAAIACGTTVALVLTALLDALFWLRFP